MPFSLRRATKVDTVLPLIKLAAISPIVLTASLWGASGLRAAHGLWTAGGLRAAHGLWTIRGVASGDASRIASLKTGGGEASGGATRGDAASRATRGSAAM